MRPTFSDHIYLALIFVLVDLYYINLISCGKKKRKEMRNIKKNKCIREKKILIKLTDIFRTLIKTFVIESSRSFAFSDASSNTELSDLQLNLALVISEHINASNKMQSDTLFSSFFLSISTSKLNKNLPWF